MSEEEESDTPSATAEAAADDAETEASEEDVSEKSDAAEGEETGDIGDDDVVRVAMTARTIESDQLVDTTDPEVAEEEGIDTDEQTIEPRVIPIGAGHLFPSVEEAFVGHDVGDTGSVTVSPTEGFGEYDPDQVRTVSAETLPEDDRYPGARVNLEGEQGFVERVIGGRARVDFNHPLAGEEIEYEYEILDRIGDPIEQAQGILKGIVDVDLDCWIQTDEVEQEVTPDEEGDDEGEPETELVDQRTLYIESVPQMAMNQQWLFQKRQVAQQLIDRLDLDRVVIQETIEDEPAPMGMGPGADVEDVASAIEDVDLDEEDLDIVEDDEEKEAILDDDEE